MCWSDKCFSFINAAASRQTVTFCLDQVLFTVFPRRLLCLYFSSYWLKYMDMSTETSWLLLLSIMEQYQWGLSMFVETKQDKLSVGGHGKVFGAAESSSGPRSAMVEQFSTKCLWTSCCSFPCAHYEIRCFRRAHGTVWRTRHTFKDFHFRNFKL